MGLVIPGCPFKLYIGLTEKDINGDRVNKFPIKPN